MCDRGQKDVMENADTLRMRLAGHLYELRLDGGAEVRVGFLAVAAIATGARLTCAAADQRRESAAWVTCRSSSPRCSSRPPA
jgi:hypothetical protein